MQRVKGEGGGKGGGDIEEEEYKGEEEQHNQYEKQQRQEKIIPISETYITSPVDHEGADVRPKHVVVELEAVIARCREWWGD